MDVQSVKELLAFSCRKKKWLMLSAICGASGYGVYKVLNSPSMVKKRKRLLMLFGALVSFAESVSDSAETINVVYKDLRDTTQALTVGVSRGCKQESGNASELANSSLTDKVLDKVFSDSGTGFVSVIVGSFTRNLVLGFGSSGGENGGLSDVPKWVSDDKCKELMADCIQRFVSTAVAVYMDKTMNTNSYDEMFAGMTNPNHQSKVTDLLGSVCNGVVETLVKTSHQALTSSNSGSTCAIVYQSGNAGGRRDCFDDGAFLEAKRGQTSGISSQSSDGFVSSITEKILNSPLIVALFTTPPAPSCSLCRSEFTGVNLVRRRRRRVRRWCSQRFGRFEIEISAVQKFEPIVVSISKSLKIIFRNFFGIFRAPEDASRATRAAAGRVAAGNRFNRFSTGSDRFDRFQPVRTGLTGLNRFDRSEPVHETHRIVQQLGPALLDQLNHVCQYSPSVVKPAISRSTI
ncbi:putative BSD domain-containing protein [Hibiscus syriacus]|uniref:BSD domain-containing protein n=1 Tax=Hibiscus syriacus TaxID=106335 RepID=A0A6A3BEQ6_HIBSY|nr:putative BSD domain-containing protein [Hibiscus syriacus]